MLTNFRQELARVIGIDRSAGSALIRRVAA